MSEWKECKLGDIASKIGSGATPTGGENSYKSAGITLIRSQNVYDFHFDIGGLAFIDEEQANLLNNVSVEEHDILMNITGESVTRCCLVPKEYLPARVNQHVSIIRPINKEADYKFVFYYLHSIKLELNSIAEIGCTRRALTKGTIENLSIFLPPLPEQRAIAGVLSSLDDKIDLLHRQNKTLEGIAEAIFRKLFLEQEKHSSAICFDHYVNCINGVSYKSSELNPSKTALVTLKSFNRYGGFSIDGFKEFTGKYKEQQIVLEGDLVVAHTDITQEAEVLGNPALIISSPIYDTLVISMDLVKVVPKIDWISNEFLYFLMRSREFKYHCLGCANGTTVLHLNKEAIPTFEFSMPDKSKVIEFSKQAKELIQQIFAKHREIHTLSSLCDTLLPKLMSGEVRVKYFS